MTPLHPITDALNTPEAASIIVAVVLGAVGTLGAYLRLVQKRLAVQLEVLNTHSQEIKAAAQAAERDSAAIKTQTNNDHSSNLRMDLDETRAKVDQISELATSTNGIVRQLGNEIAGIRRDLTAMRDRQSNEERAHTVLAESAKTDHERIWKAIDKLKDQA
jgi:hypothetical protein